MAFLFLFQWIQKKVGSSVCNETPCVLLKSGSYPSELYIFFLFVADPTRIIQGPVDMEIIVGESIVLPCQVASDPVLDVSFSWAFNGQLITKGDGHFELVGGVSDPYSEVHRFFKNCDSKKISPVLLVITLHQLFVFPLPQTLILAPIT